MGPGRVPGRDRVTPARQQRSELGPAGRGRGGFPLPLVAVGWWLEAQGVAGRHRGTEPDFYTP